MANKGEWSEPYAALRIIGEGKIYIADENGNKNPMEWMSVLELMRHETKERLVLYKLNSQNVDVDIYVNDEWKLSVQADRFLSMADTLSDEIRNGKGNSFDVSQDVSGFLQNIELKHIKASSVDKSDVFLSVRDPRAGVVREHIGFSIKSDFGKDHTLFNTAKASGFIYELDNMNDTLMKYINSLMDKKGHAAVQERCDKLLENHCNPTFVGLPIAKKAKCKAFEENLDLINPRLVQVIEKILSNHFFEHDAKTDLFSVTQRVVEQNPCCLMRPEIKYEYMIKSFVYAAYCGMTASTLWSGDSQVNGGFIKVNSNGEVLAYYALESDAFKTYLYENCYLEFPSTDEKHGFYGNVYKENGKYYFRLNFQIRYK